MDYWRDRAARRRRTSLDIQSCHRKVSHAPTRAGVWTESCRRGAARDGACGAVFRWGCHQRVDRPRTPRNLRFPTGEVLAGKVSGGGGGKEIRWQRVPGGE